MCCLVMLVYLMNNLRMNVFDMLWLSYVNIHMNLV